MSQSLFRRITLFFAVFFISGSLFAEDKGQKAEDLIRYLKCRVEMLTLTK